MSGSPIEFAYEPEPRICKPGGKGILLPLWENENDVANGIRAPIYTFFLAYCFLGVSIVADTFMGAIEAITSRRQQIKLKSTGRVITVRIWNDTVSNLTLMALGSSAPEILLSTIELFKKSMMSGDLGPSTIVGSAAFNLMVIIGVCISLIPNGEVRKVKELTVFFITLVFSLFAYLWILFILVVVTPDKIDILEAVITFLCFPLLVLISYLADIGKLSKTLRPRVSRMKWHTEDEIPDEIVVRVCDLVGHHDAATTQASRKVILEHPELATHLENPSIPEIEKLKKALSAHKPTSRAQRRIEATRHFTGGRKQLTANLHMPHMPHMPAMPHLKSPIHWRSNSVDGSNRAPSSQAQENAFEYTTSATLAPVVRLADAQPSMVKVPSNAAGSTSMSGFRNSQTDNYVPPQARIMSSVTFAVGAQSISEELAEKSVLLVRKGDQSLDLKVTYSVNLRLDDPNAGASSLDNQQFYGATANNEMDARPGRQQSPGDPKARPIPEKEAGGGGRDSSRLDSSCEKAVASTTSSVGIGSQNRQMVTNMPPGLELVPVEVGSVVIRRSEPSKTFKVARPTGAAVAKALQAHAQAGDLDPAVMMHLSEVFILKLDEVHVVTNLDKTNKERNMPLSVVSIGPVVLTQVNIVPEDPGKLAFAYEHLTIQGTTQSQHVDVIVCRRNGCSGEVGCKFHTEQLSSVPGYDYTEAEGDVEFEEGETEKLITVEILPKGANESTDEFLIVLEEAQGGASFDANDDGGTESSILTVKINALQLSSTASGRILRMLDHYINFDVMRNGLHAWHDQFIAAVYCNGSPEEQAEANKMDWFFHILSFPWKLLFSLVPPTCFCGGWLCFYFSLLMIALVTAVIGDFAELFGCVLDVQDGVTAITFVALGTSMPDLFASRTAAMQDPFADASICNVTGSNSVNVFLGLGLPWTVGAIYWRFNDPTDKWKARYPELAAELDPKAAFIVISEDLGFSVLVFSCASLLTLGLLTFRRAALGAEFGGPVRAKVASTVSFITFWLIYLILASWKMVRQDRPDALESGLVVGFFGGFALAVFFAVLLIIYLSPRHVPRQSEADQHSKTSRIPTQAAIDSEGSAEPRTTTVDVKDYGPDPDLPVVANEKMGVQDCVTNGQLANTEDSGLPKDTQTQSGNAALATGNVDFTTNKEQETPGADLGHCEGTSTMVTVESPRSSPIGSHHEVDDVSVRRIFCCMKMCGEPTSREERKV